MIILAIEASTKICSVTLTKNSDWVISENTWNSESLGSQHLFTILSNILNKTSLAVSDIDIFAVGIGPGYFSGLRTSISAVNMLALPDKKPVIGISSGEALAMAIFNKTKQTRIITVGDARRNRFWIAQFEIINHTIKTITPYSLINTNELPRNIKTNSILVSSDWDRIKDKLINASLPDNIDLIKENCVPYAGTIAKLAYKKNKNGNLSEPVLPIYLHPPVFVKPKFKKNKSTCI